MSAEGVVHSETGQKAIFRHHDDGLACDGSRGTAHRDHSLGQQGDLFAPSGRKTAPNGKATA
jgi:hypothetical protein